MNEIEIKSNGQRETYESSDGVMSIRVPIKITRREGRKVLRKPTGEVIGRPWEKKFTVLQLALIRGHRWLRLFESGKVSSLKEIAKRERDYEEGIRKNKENANRALQMDSVLQPYEELFRQDGGRPAQTINGLLQTASALAKGGEHAANVVAHLVRQFNVPIDALDDRLSQSIGAAPAPRREPGLSPAHIEQMVEQSIAKREQQFQMQQVGSELQQFANDPKNEFYNDVRGTMSTYLRVQAEQGQPVDLQGAYDWACKADPEISKILMARQAAPTAAQRRASKSITGNMGGSAPAQTAGTLREQLEQQFNDLGIG